MAASFSSGPSSAPLFKSQSELYDETAGWPSRETGVDPLIHTPGSHQFLGHQAAHHEDHRIESPGANGLLPGVTPTITGPAIGAPDNVNPLGRHSSASLQDN